MEVGAFVLFKLCTDLKAEAAANRPRRLLPLVKAKAATAAVLSPLPRIPIPDTESSDPPTLLHTSSTTAPAIPHVVPSVATSMQAPVSIAHSSCYLSAVEVTPMTAESFNNLPQKFQAHKASLEFLQEVAVEIVEFKR